MTAADHDTDIAPLRAKLNSETARSPWHALLRFFASGDVVAVSDELDLVEVALCLAANDQVAVAAWLEGGSVAKVTDEQARAWLEEDAELWTVVVKPWVLVQREKRKQG